MDVIRKGDFSTLHFGGLKGLKGSGICPFDRPALGYYWLPVKTYDPSLTLFEQFSWLQKHFYRPARPPDTGTITIPAEKLLFRRRANTRYVLAITTD